MKTRMQYDQEFAEQRQQFYDGVTEWKRAVYGYHHSETSGLTGSAPFDKITEAHKAIGRAIICLLESGHIMLPINFRDGMFTENGDKLRHEYLSGYCMSSENGEEVEVEDYNTCDKCGTIVIAYGDAICGECKVEQGQL